MATIEAMNDPGPLRNRKLGAFVTKFVIPVTTACSRGEPPVAIRSSERFRTQIWVVPRIATGETEAVLDLAAVEPSSVVNRPPSGAT